MDSSSDCEVLREKKFILQQLLGEGSYAKVFRALYIVDETHSEELACKVIDTTSAPRIYLTKFLPRELEILAHVNHPNIIYTSSIFQRHAKYFVFMQLGENGDLLTYIAKRGPLSENQTRFWMRQLFSAIEYMHALNVVHRDLKCENVLISRNFNVKLTDFGFARRTRDSSDMSDTFCGSLLYAAPEILKGLFYVPKMADIWSLGIIMYVMLNKALPFNESSVTKLYDKQIQRMWRFRTSVVNVLSNDAKQSVAQMLHPEAAQRPTASALINGPWIAMDPRIAKTSGCREEGAISTYCVGKIQRYNCKSTFESLQVKYLTAVITEPTPVEESCLKYAAKEMERPRRADAVLEVESQTGTLKTLKKMEPNLYANTTTTSSGPLQAEHSPAT